MTLSRPLSVVLLGCLVGVACGGAQESAPKSPETITVFADERAERPARAKPKSRATPKPQPVAIPTACAQGNGSMCVPPKEFVEKLCESSRPNVALTMFRKGTPWTRAYVRVMQVEAWYASGARSRPAKLRFAEEVLVIADRSSQPSGMVVSGSGSYDVLRWDGTCVSVMNDEVSLRSPGSPDVAMIDWKRLNPTIQDALEKDTKISFRNNNRREKCKEMGAGADRRCDRAKVGLSRMIGAYVRGGGDLPELTHIPTGME